MNLNRDTTNVFVLSLLACGAFLVVLTVLPMQSAASPAPTDMQQVAIVQQATATSGFGAIVGPNAQPLPTATPKAGSAPAQPANGTQPAYGPVVGPPINSQQNPTQSAPSQLGPTTIATLPPVVTPSTNPTSGAVGGTPPSYGPVIPPNYTPPPSPTPALAPQQPAPNVTLPPPFTPGPSPTPGPVLRRDLMGIQVHGFLTNEEWDVMLDHVRALGLGWVKVQVQWEDMEPVKGQFSLQYNTLILAVQRAKSPNIRVLLSIAKAPDWARPASVRGKEDGPPENPQDLADFVTRILRDCKAESIDAIEVWNEPNLIREWRGRPISGAEYMRYFSVVYNALIEEQKRQTSAYRPNHRIVIVTAGPAPTGTSSVSLNDRDWLQQLYDAGLAKYADDVALGVHPYGWANPPDAMCCKQSPGVTGWYEHPSFYFRNTLDDTRRITVRNNDAKRKLWITEFGYASYDGLRRSDGSSASNTSAGWIGLLNRDQQAQYVVRAFNLTQQPPYYDFVGPVFLWNLNFATIPQMTDQGREEAAFSLLDQARQPRPVYRAIQGLAKQ